MTKTANKTVAQLLTYIKKEGKYIEPGQEHISKITKGNI